MLCHCLFARFCLRDVYSVAKFHNVQLLNFFTDVANVVCRDKTPTLRLLLKSCIDVLLQEYVTLGFNFKSNIMIQISNSGPLKLDKLRIIMKGVN